MRIKHQVFKLSKTGAVEPVDKKADCHEDLSSAAASVDQPGTYVVLPVLIINPKSKNDGKEKSAGDVDENNSAGQTTEEKESGGEVDQSNKASEPGAKRGRKKK